jgi:DNA-binding XRE family transcriptional regulator
VAKLRLVDANERRKAPLFTVLCELFPELLRASIHRSALFAMRATLSRKQTLPHGLDAPDHRGVPKKNPKPVPPQLKTLPKRITQAREDAGLTKTAVAEKMGVAPSQVTRWENGERKEGIELATVLRLAEALGCNDGWLATGRGDRGPIPVWTGGGDKRRRKPDGDQGTS